MPQSLSVVCLHLVFSTKDRRPFLREQKIRESLHAYLGENGMNDMFGTETQPRWGCELDQRFPRGNWNKLILGRSAWADRKSVV